MAALVVIMPICCMLVPANRNMPGMMPGARLCFRISFQCLVWVVADRLFLCFRINPGSKTRLPSMKRSEINAKGCIESIARRCATKPVPQTIAAKSNKVSPSILLSQSGVFFIGRIIVCLRLFWASQVKFFYSGGTL